MSMNIQPSERLSSLTQRIVQTYDNFGTIGHWGQFPQPRYDIIAQVITELQEILFPGFRRREGLQRDNVADYVGEWIEKIHQELATQIARVLRLEATRREDKLPEEDYQALGQAKSLLFLERIPGLRRLLAKDAQAACDGDPACHSVAEVVMCYPGLEAITIQRLAHVLYELEVPLIPRMMAEWAHGKTGIDIHPGATIGERFFIDHGTGVVIGETTQIGERVKIYQGVTLGALSFPTDAAGNLVRGRKRHPTVEDRVVIYANATVLGGNTVVGHDSVIGASVMLTQSVAPRTTVVLEKPKLRIRSEGSSNDVDFQI